MELTKELERCKVLVLCLLASLMLNDIYKSTLSASYLFCPSKGLGILSKILFVGANFEGVACRKSFYQNKCADVQEACPASRTNRSG